MLQELLARVREGDEEASSELFTRLYAELRALAGFLFRGQGVGHSLQPTAVLHEAWVKMARAGSGEKGFADKTHFFRVAARAMRQVLVNHARDRAAKKRGDGLRPASITLTGLAGQEAGDPVDVLAVHEALEALAELDERQARVAELRFFAGMTNPEIAEALEVSLRTVELDWRMAKTWLGGRLRPRE